MSWGKPVSKLFKKFDDKPVGSASIAQVHAAQLPDGTRVAVKVQRPDIQEVIELDLAVLLDLARFVDRHVPEISAVNPVGVVLEFSSTLRKELDFNNEASTSSDSARNLPTIGGSRFRGSFASWPHRGC